MTMRGALSVTLLVAAVFLQVIAVEAVYIGKDLKIHHSPVQVAFVNNEITVMEGEAAPVQLVAVGLSKLRINKTVSVKIERIRGQGKYSRVLPATPIGSVFNAGDFVVDLGTFEDYFTAEFLPGNDFSTIHHVWTVQDNLYEGTETVMFRIAEVELPQEHKGQVERQAGPRAYITIQDDDAVEVRFTSSHVTVKAGESVSIGALCKGSPLQSPLSIGIICYKPLQSTLQAVHLARANVDFVLPTENSAIGFSHQIWTQEEQVSSQNVTIATKRNKKNTEGKESFVCTFRSLPQPSDPLKITRPDRIVITIEN